MTSGTPAAGSTVRRESVVPSVVRTVTPVIVAAVVSYLFGLDVVKNILDAFGVTVDQATTGFTVTVTAVLTAVYYWGVRLLETYVKPQFGWLLGLSKSPVYEEVRNEVTGRFGTSGGGV
jgi:hypothetical protein